MAQKEIGEVELIPYEMKHIEWSIPDFFSITKDVNSSPWPCVSPAFTIADMLWHMKLYTGDEHLLFFETNMERKHSVEYYFGFKKSDGCMEQLVSGILKEKVSCGNQAVHLISKTKLHQRKSEFVNHDALTIICTLKWMAKINNSTQHNLLDQTKSMKFIRLDKLSENFKDLFADKESCDVTLKVQDKEYKVHKSVLIARSSVFAANFKHDTLERQTGIISIPDCDPDSFQIFLEYLYCGKLEEFSFPSALNLYYTSDKYDVSELKAFCIEYLKQSLTVDNICEVAVFADKYDETQLISVVSDFFNKNGCKISETSEWECLLEKNYRLANKFLKEMLKGKSKE